MRSLQMAVVTVFAVIFGGSFGAEVSFSTSPTELNGSGWALWNNSANWQGGKLPKIGDDVVILGTKTIGSIGGIYNSVIYRSNSNVGLSGSGFQFPPGAVGFRLETATSPSYWLTIYTTNNSDTVYYICSGGAISATEHVYGPGRIRKTGSGTMKVGNKPSYAVADSSVSNRRYYTWAGEVIAEGTFGYGGYELGLVGHEIVFAGEGVVLSLGSVGQTFRDVNLHEDGITGHFHAITAASKSQIVFTGAPARVNTVFTGVFMGGAGLRWAPNSSTYSFEISGSTSTSTGRLDVVNGIVRLSNGASWPSLSGLHVSTGGRLVVASGASVPMLMLDAGAKLRLEDGVQLALPEGSVTVAGEGLGYGVYAATSTLGAHVVDWMEGDGVLCIGGALPKNAASGAVDGWYVYGNAGWTSGGDWYATMALPDFRSLYFPPEAKIRFTGGILFDSFPEETVSQFDWSTCTGIGVARADAVGAREIPVRNGSMFWFMPCSTIAADGNGMVSRTLAADSATAARTLVSDVALDGTWYVNDTTRSVTHAGRLSGAGRLYMYNFSRTFTHTGNWAFNGTVDASQAKNEVFLKPTAVSGKIAWLKMNGFYGSYDPTRFVYNPQFAHAPHLSIEKVTSGKGGLTATGARTGQAMCVWGGNGIDIGSLASGANSITQALHLVAADSTANTRTSAGRGAFVVGNIPTASCFLLYDAVDFMVTNVSAATTFAFLSESNKVNSGTFTQAGNTCAAGTKFLARTPQMLPATVTGFTGAVELEGTEWNVIMDFANADACRRTVAADWTYPDDGVIKVRWIGGEPQIGVLYPLLDFAPGAKAADVARWPVVLAEDRSGRLTVVRTTTQLCVKLDAANADIAYYVDSENGNDAANGFTPATAWKTLARVNAADLWAGDRVLFKRGGLWRGQLVPKSGEAGRPIFYGAYGEGTKPIIEYSVAAETPGRWEATSTPNVWRTTETFSVDVGCVILNHGEDWGWKVYKLADVDATNPNRYLYNRTDKRVYLYSEGDPSTKWRSIEFALKGHVVNEGGKHDVTYDGLWVRYGSAHGFGGGNVRGITIRNCDVCWIGGSVQEWNVNANGDEVPTRYGNGIEFWDSARDCVVEGNRLWEIYDAALTTQGHSDGIIESNIVYRYNVVWNAEYSFEMWTNPNEHTKPSLCMDVYITNNTAVNAGGCWSHLQRPNGVNGSHLMFYGHSAPTTNFVIRNNVFCGCTEWYSRISTGNNSMIQIDDNLIWEPGRSFCYFWYYSYAPQTEFSAYQTALGWDAHSTLAEPKFFNAAARDYRLIRSSPGIVNGVAPGAFPIPVSLHTVFYVW